jgi:hypothetical protein
MKKTVNRIVILAIAIPALISIIIIGIFKSIYQWWTEFLIANLK